jgi:uncharacterized protein involved in exopolysaccharide biosynthesis
MSEIQRTITKHAAEVSDELTWMDVLLVLSRFRKRLLAVSLCVALVAAAVSTLLPPRFTANTKLLPPQQAQSGAAALLSQLGSLGGAAVGIGGVKNPNDVYVGMLRSRVVADKLIDKFALRTVYETDSLEQARGQLADSTLIATGKDGLISIEFMNKDKKLVAPVANAYVAELIELTKVLAVTEAGQRRMFYERQLQVARDNLTNAEAALKSGLDKRGVISVDAESQTLVATIGRLRANISAKEIQLSSMRAFVTANNQEYKKAEEELNSMRAELSRLEGGSVSPSATTSDDKRSGFESIKLLRDVKYYQMLYELLAKQYEIARLDEAKTPSVIQVLDPAVEPERKAGPRRLNIVIISTFGAFFASVIVLILIEWRRKLLATDAGALRWRQLKEVWRR